MWILLLRRHLLFLLSLVVIVVVVVLVVVVVMVVLMIVQVAVVVVVKSWPELVNYKFEARAGKYKSGARTGKCKLGTGGREIQIPDKKGIFIRSRYNLIVNHERLSRVTFCKSRHQRCSIKKAVLKNSGIFTGKHLCWSLFLIKLPSCCRPSGLKVVFLWIIWNI